MNHLELAQEIKTRNMIEMAWGYATMTRVLLKGSGEPIVEQLGRLFAGLELIAEQKDYDAAHADFCDWFTRRIRTRRKKRSSYGHAAKVLDISAKVYVYYCAQPSDDVARRLVPMLHGAVDTQIMKKLANLYPDAGVRSKTLQEVDREEYKKLQRLVARDIEATFQSQIHPVQYDDIMWRTLNRPRVQNRPL